MDLITVDADKCKKDGMCVAVCPSRALELAADGGPAVADAAICNACGHCVAVCPHGALVNSRVDAVNPDAPLQPASRDWPAPEAMDRLLRGRRSIRAYADKPVARQVMEELLDVARYAPTASNVQEIRWIAVVDPAKVHALAGLTSAFFATGGQRAKYSAMWERGRDYFLRGAPALVVVHTDASIAFGPADCGIALTFFELAAVSRGLGTCWAGLFDLRRQGRSRRAPGPGHPRRPYCPRRAHARLPEVSLFHRPPAQSRVSVLVVRI